jgi:putative membrane protein
MTALPPLSWSTLVQTWDVGPGRTLVAVALLAAYVLPQRRGRRVPCWRAASFGTGVALLWLTLDSGLAAYADALFWVHMVVHLLLVMVVPALLVLGHPLTATGLARTRVVTALTHPLVGLAAYGVVIVGTHLTAFMDHMGAHPWLGPLEELLYVGAGWLLLTPLVGEEPIRWRPPVLGRIGLLVVAMVPDTVVGIVLLQASTNPFPAMFPGTTWGPDPLADVQTGGAIMWVGGDGLMMLLAVGLVLALVAGHGRDHVLGSWLESVRRDRLETLTGQSLGEEPDDETALAAYNRMLARRAREER